MTGHSPAGSPRTRTTRRSSRSPPARPLPRPPRPRALLPAPARSTSRARPQASTAAAGRGHLPRPAAETPRPPPGSRAASRPARAPAIPLASLSLLRFPRTAAARRAHWRPRFPGSGGRPPVLVVPGLPWVRAGHALTPDGVCSCRDRSGIGEAPDAVLDRVAVPELGAHQHRIGIVHDDPGWGAVLALGAVARHDQVLCELAGPGDH